MIGGLVQTFPKDLFPSDKLSELLVPVFGLEAARERRVGQSELERLGGSAALLTGIAASRFSEEDNHYACIQAWVIFCVSLVAAVERWDGKWSRSLTASLALGEAAIHDALVCLWREVSQRNWLVEGDPLADHEVHGWRSAVLLGLLASLSMAADENNGLLEAKDRDALDSWLGSGKAKPILWGEGAVASLVPWLLHLRKHNATLQPDVEICQLASAILVANQPGSRTALASPYYDIYEVLEADVQSTYKGLSLSSSSIRRETFAGSSFTIEAVFNLMARTGLKTPCRVNWPLFTKIALRTFKWELPWQYCLFRSEDGVESTRIPVSTYSWDDLRRSCTLVEEGRIPSVLLAKTSLMTLWWQVAPHRFCDASCKAVASNYLPGWGT